MTTAVDSIREQIKEYFSSHKFNIITTIFSLCAGFFLSQMLILDKLSVANDSLASLKADSVLYKQQISTLQEIQSENRASSRLSILESRYETGKEAMDSIRESSRLQKISIEKTKTDVLEIGSEVHKLRNDHTSINEKYTVLSTVVNNKNLIEAGTANDMIEIIIEQASLTDEGKTKLRKLTFDLLTVPVPSRVLEYKDVDKN